MRRPNGTGTIVKLSGSRRRPYVVRIPGRDKRGRVIQTALSYHPTAKEAQAALDAYNRALEQGKAPAADKLNTTLEAVYTGWSTREYRKLKPQSISSYTAAWKKRVSRYGSMKMRDITLDHWQAILDEGESEGRSQSSINNDAILIKALCSYAMERDIIGKDYSAYLDIPSVGAKKTRDALTDLQLAKLTQLAAEGEPWADTALMLCYTGFRVSEFLSLTRFSYHPECGGYLQGGLKTRAGKDRIVPIHPKIKPYLLHWLSKGGDTIICDDAGHPISAQKYRENFSALMQKVGAPNATPHWCRHTFATMLHKHHADPLTTKWLLGHSTESDITAHYTHSTIESLCTAISLLA